MLNIENQKRVKIYNLVHYFKFVSYSAYSFGSFRLSYKMRAR